VAVRGGLDVPVVLGSRATSVQARLPGLAGRALRAGDVIPIGNRALRQPRRFARPGAIEPPMPRQGGDAVRFIWGPDKDLFPPDDLDAFLGGNYRISTTSNRMGYRLEGPAVRPAGGGLLLSEATPIGSLQVPPSGEPILLMADRQTTGGYARIGTVISADIRIAGQLAPGDTIRFVPCEIDEAIQALREQQRAVMEFGASR
jgi:antagonist of KipI